MKKFIEFINKERHIKINLIIFKIDIDVTITWLIDFMCKIGLAITIAFLIVELYYK